MAGFLDELAAQDTGAKAAARGSFLDEIAGEDETQIRTGTPAIKKDDRSAFSAPYSYFTPEVQRLVGNSASVRPLEEVAPGINQGVAQILGLPVTTLVNAGNLASAGVGFAQSQITGEAPSATFDPVDPAGVPLTGAWFEQMLNSTPLGDVTSVRNPDDPVARVVHNTAAGIPGGVVGGGPLTPNLVTAAAGGGSGALAAEAGADPATQAVASLLAGTASGRAMPLNAAPDAPAADAPEPPRRTGFENENMGAASAAMDLKNVSPGLRQALDKATQDGSLNREVVTRHIEADSLPIPMRLTRGQATQDPTLLSKEQNLRGTDPRFAADFKLQNQQLIDNMDEIRATAAPNVVHADPVQSGQALLDAYKTAVIAPKRAELDAKYQAMREAASGEFPLDTQALLTNVRAALKKDLTTSKAPSDVMAELEAAAASGSMSFEQFEALRTSLARIQRASADGQERHAAGVIRNQIEELPMQGASADLKKLADDARKANRDWHAQIEKDPALRAAIDDDTPVGELSPLADKFIDKFVVKGRAANLKTMQENLGADATAKETIAAGALNYLKQKAGINAYTNEGNFSQAGYNRALAELTPKLQFMVPGALADQIQALGNVARYTLAQPRGSFVNNSNTFVAAAAEKALPVLEGVLNVNAGGLPVGTFVRKKVESRSARKFYEQSTEPGAGVKLNTLLNAGKKK